MPLSVCFGALTYRQRRQRRTPTHSLNRSGSTSDHEVAHVAVTPDELGNSWRDGRVHLPMRVFWNGRGFGHPNAGAMGLGFHELIAHAAYSRNLSAGTIVGSGTISNDNYREVGSAWIAERRAIEIADHGHASTEYMRFGDRVRIEMLDENGHSVFGAIDQRIVPAKG